MPSIWGPNTISSIIPAVTLSQNALPIANTLTQNEATIFGTLVNVRGKLVPTAVGTIAFPLTMVVALAGYIFKATQYGIPVGQFILTIAAGGNKFEGSIILSAANTFIFACNNNANFLGVAPAYAAAIGDSLTFNLLAPLG